MGEHWIYTYLDGWISCGAKIDFMKMNETVKEIIKSSWDEEHKNKALDQLLKDIQIGRDIVSGKLKYCHECDDYYLAKSFYTESESKEEQICVHEDCINSGGNECVDGIIDTIYEVCPKGHRRIIHYNKRRK